MVGKTSFITKYFDNIFNEHGTQATISWDFKTKTVHLGDGDPNSPDFKAKETVRLFVWDTAGQERFRQIARMYYNEVAGAFICFDLTDEDSFAAVNFWLNDLQTNAPKNIVCILCGLKLDLVQIGSFSKTGSDMTMKRMISTETAQTFAQKNKMYYMEISSKTGHNVQEAVYKMTYEMNENAKRNAPLIGSTSTLKSAANTSGLIA